MPDVIIKEVPEGAEEEVINMAMLAIERFLRRNTKVADEIQTKIKTDMDSIRKSNSL